MQTAPKCSRLYIHHHGGAACPRGGVYRKSCIFMQFAYTLRNAIQCTPPIFLFIFRPRAGGGVYIYIYIYGVPIFVQRGCPAPSGLHGISWVCVLHWNGFLVDRQIFGKDLTNIRHLPRRFDIFNQDLTDSANVRQRFEMLNKYPKYWIEIQRIRRRFDKDPTCSIRCDKVSTRIRQVFNIIDKDSTKIRHLFDRKGPHDPIVVNGV